MIKGIHSTKPPEKTRVVVAMSGGVDSSCVAAMLKKAGYEVIGVTLQLYDEGEILKKKGACCAGQDIYDAKRVAEKFNFPHYVLNYESLFKEAVIEDFADAYVRGETPIPCVRCNQTVKFRDLLKVAKDLNADTLATGHYVQKLMGKKGAELHAGADKTKDQSYFLFATTLEQLNMLSFPLGGQDKSQTREMARELGLSLADKPDSQDICFVPNGDYAGIVERLRPDAMTPGIIRHVDGRIMGEHAGIIHYTIGQRRGLGLGGEKDPLYVVKINADTHEVIVGEKKHLLVKDLYMTNVNWLGDEIDNAIDVTVKVRSTTTPVAACYYPQQFRVAFTTPQPNIAPGQACVFYDGTRVLGGGWIKKP